MSSDAAPGPDHPTQRWEEVERVAPEPAGAVRARFDAARHHVLATLTADGSPRVSGTEVAFWRGDVVVGSARGSRRAADLLRDPRCALHAHTGDGSMAGGDAKLSATAEDVTDPVLRRAFLRSSAGGAPDGPADFHLFRLSVVSATLVDLAPDPAAPGAGDALRVRTHHPGRAVTTTYRG